MFCVIVIPKKYTLLDGGLSKFSFSARVLQILRF
jgi:hypothetical protein